MLRVFKIQHKLQQHSRAVSKVRSLRVNGVHVPPAALWPVNLRPQDALVFLEWKPYLELHEQLQGVGPKVAKQLRERQVALVRRAKQRSTSGNKSENCVEFELLSLSDAEVRDCWVVAITSARVSDGLWCAGTTRSSDHHHAGAAVQRMRGALPAAAALRAACAACRAAHAADALGAQVLQVPHRG